MRSVPLERDILRQCLAACMLTGIQARRRNVGAFTNAAGQLVKCGHAGESDITGTITRGPHRGRRIEIEVKRPGNRPTPHQLDFLRQTIADGGLALWTDDADKLLLCLRWIVDEGARTKLTDEGKSLVYL